MDPAPGSLGAAGLVELFALGQEEDVFTGVLLLRGDEAQGAVAMVVVVPLDELVGPLPGFPHIGEALGRREGWYFPVGKKASAWGLSLLTRGRECVAVMPS